MPQTPIKFTNQNYLLPPKEQPVYPIEVRNLERLEKMIKRIDQQGGFYQNLGFGSAGVATGALTSLISLNYAQGVSVTILVISWGLLFASFAVAVFGFIASTRERQQLRVSKEDLLAEVQWIKESVYAPETETTVASTSSDIGHRKGSQD